MSEDGLVSSEIKCEVEKPPASFKSSVWQAFGFPIEYINGKKLVKKDETVCRLCYLRIRYTGSTTNMSTHLRRHHPDIDCNDYGQSKCSKPFNISDDKKRTSLAGQLRLSEAFKTKLSSRSTRAQAITNGIGTFIAMDMRPYSVVENIGFKYLIHTLEPRYEIPSRTHFTNYVIPEMYKKVKSSVMESIARASSMAVTTDGWTSRSTESYITITAHYVNEDWQLENPVLQTRTLHESHTGANLANVLESAVDEWNLGKFSQIAISTDNASNIVSAVKQSRFAPHIRCFAHTINIASQKTHMLHLFSGQNSYFLNCPITN
ncbi:E3 SUMO-protein ligase ZBED1-like [Haliotis rubra]|uniref:E3 SUMO-protein ligase ZBED1-like n=1 Tax=Haliotis rubra TaxID=36100 RepID=UPI001EE59B2A|nr:E3 SUMO-protein ligase ZBED1-like [Haliotis rubra]